MEDTVLDETEDSPTPTLDFDAPVEEFSARPIKRQAMDALIARAMSGLLPRNRALKSWEPAFLDERHMQVVMMRASGLKQVEISNILGIDQSRVSIILNHPDAQYILTKLVSYAADEVLDIQARIKAHAGEALDKVIEVMRTTQDQRLASANAFEILKMAGHGATEKRDVKVEVAINREVADNLSSAIAESMQIMATEGVDYKIFTSPGNASSVLPAASGDSGPGSTDQPPGSDSLRLDPQEKVA